MQGVDPSLPSGRINAGIVRTGNANTRGPKTLVSIALPAAGALSVAEVFVALDSSDAGLTADEVAKRRLVYGPNQLMIRRVTVLGVLVRQLRNPLLFLLLGAATVSVATGGLADGVIIAVIVSLSVGLGFVNEFRSESAVAELQSNVHHEALVWRDGAEKLVDVAELVPGDVVALRMGALVPADVRVVESNQLECDEGVLTGESRSSVKTDAPSTTDSAVDLPSCGFMGTVVRQGSGRAVVVATGSTTAFGKIAAGLGEAQTQTAFQVGLRDFSKLLVTVAGVLTVSIFVINIAFSRPVLQALLFSLAIAIGITPQLLPAIVSVSLASGSRALARKNVLVKRLVTIEDLGNIEVLFTDKTGTLTDGTVTFERSLNCDGVSSNESLLLGLLCNEAAMTSAGAIGGNALDAALWRAPEATSDAHELSAFVRLDMLPFDHDRQLVSVLVRHDSDSQLIVTKGAPEAVLARCVDVQSNSGVLLRAHATLEELFRDGARVVAVAKRVAREIVALEPTEERDLEFVGFLTFLDKPKANVSEAVAKLQRLGVTLKVITGDNGTVAAKVCRDIGIDVQGVVTGAELTRMTDEELTVRIPTTTIFARVSPDQKSRIVKSVRQGGKDVGFLGDGVNDAVALHSADVGISVESATDVAKDAADIVLLDKDLGVLSDAILEGRRIFANTLKYVLMATSSNFGNMFSAAGASLFLSFLPMLPSQILLNNLLYDVGQLSIPTDNVDEEALARPAAWNIQFVRRFMSVFGPISSIFDFLTFFVMLRLLHASHSEFRTGWFVESLVTQTIVVLVIRTRRVPFLRSRPSPAILFVPAGCAALGIALPFTPLAKELGFTTLPIRFFLILGAMTFLYMFLVEFAKSRFYRSIPVPPVPDQPRHHHRRVSRRVVHFTKHSHVRHPKTRWAKPR
jgi:P-type Mg2+ transporter